VSNEKANANTTLPPASPDAPARGREEANAPNALSTAYPKAMWRADGYFAAATSRSEEERMLAEGWSPTFIPPRQPQAAQGNVQASGLDPLAMLIREVLESVLDERGLGEKRKREPFGTKPMQWIGPKGQARDQKEQRNGT